MSMNAAQVLPATLPLWQVSHEWEHNGRDDSDWYVVAYDPETDELRRVNVGTTRFPVCSKPEHGHGSYSGDYSNICYACSGVNAGPLPPDIEARARACLRRRWEAHFLAAETWRVEHYSDAGPGTRVRTKEVVKNRPRTETVSKCDRCHGSGKWVNPNRAGDERACFGCGGTGEVKRSSAAKGKAIEIPEGTAGTVVQEFVRKSQYGTWTQSHTVIVRRDDGTEFRAPASALRLDEEVDPARVRRLVDANAGNAYGLFATSAIRMVERTGVI